MYEGIYGHNKQKTLLNSMIENNRLSHAYLFYGPDGIGKKQIALEFAKNILNVDNLNTCVDFKYIEKREDKKEILVEQIREGISEDTAVRPISSNKKVYIINDAHLLNDVAQNALLKTLEEPPSYIVIILIASNISSLLPTILSRLSKIEFSNLSVEEVEEYCKKNELVISKDIIDFAGGSIGKIQNITLNNFQENLNKVGELANHVISKDIISCFIKSQEIDFTNRIYLDYLQFQLFKNSCYESSLEVERAVNRLKMNGNYDIVIDNMLIKCIESI